MPLCAAEVSYTSLVYFASILGAKFHAAQGEAFSVLSKTKGVLLLTALPTRIPLLQGVKRFVVRGRCETPVTGEVLGRWAPRVW